MRRLLLLPLLTLLAACGTTPTAPLPTIAPTLLPPPNALVLGEPVSGMLTREDRLNDWAFNGRAGQPVSAQISGPGLTLTLFDNAGETLAQGPSLGVALPVTGLYVLRVQLTAGEQSDYTLTVRENPPPATATPTPTPSAIAALGEPLAELNSAEATFGAFNQPDDTHLYTFNAGAGGFIRVRMADNSGALDPLLTLYTPDGVAIAIDDNSGGGRAALLDGIALPQAGTYTLAASGGAARGTYEITLETAGEPFPVTPVVGTGDPAATTPTPPPIVLTPTLAAAVSGTQLTSQVPASATLERSGTINRHIIQANAGDVFTVGVRATTPNFIPRVEITSPSGAIVAEVTAPGPEGEALIGPLEAPATGGYVVFVSGASNTVGSYTVGYGAGRTRETVRMGETFADRTYEASITRQAINQDWLLRLKAGDMIRASATGTDGRFDPALAFIGPEGNTLIRDNDGAGDLAAQIFSVRAPADGVYALSVTSIDPLATGAYALNWFYVEVAPTPTPQLLTAGLFTIEDTITPDEPRSYPVQGVAGERLLIEVEAEPGSGLDTLVELIAPNGEVVASDDDSGGNLNPSLLTAFPQDGLYQVRVLVYDDGNNTGGAFVLRVRRALNAP